MDKKSLPGILFTVLRIFIGWHFLYEGFAKLLSPNWTSAGYLANSSWILSGFFHWIVNNPPVLSWVDFINTWGLILIGFGLVVGIYTRVFAIGASLLLALYYIANPPFIGMGDFSAEGSYLIVNKNLIELVMTLVLAVLPRELMWGFDRLIQFFQVRRTGFGNAADLSCAESAGVPERREWLKALASVPVLGGFTYAVARKKSYEEQLLAASGETRSITSATIVMENYASLKELTGPVPFSTIKDVEISRILCGGNLISGFAHSRDLVYVSPLIKRYFTEEKIFETFQLCEACGVNTAVLRTDDFTVRYLKRYRDRGGKIQWLAQTYPSAGDPISSIRQAIDNGAVGAFVQGNIADTLVRSGKFELLAEAVEYIKSQGVIAGTACHSLRTVQMCEEQGLEMDFYMKTLHRDDYWSAQPRDTREEYAYLGSNQPGHDSFHDNIWCMNPEETAEYMKQVKTPWIAYKVLAAGAVPPEAAFRYVFNKGADFACVGMFDFQVVEDANIANRVLGEDLKRERNPF
jgi:uncharacterized membrane protein YphA (DoxX/SURF4 family)